MKGKNKAIYSGIRVLFKCLVRYRT